MRFPLVVAVAVVGISVSGLAQQNDKAFKVKHSTAAKAPKTSVPLAKASNSATSSGANARDLKALERQTAKTSPSRTGGGANKTAPLKPVKEKANAPMNFNGGGSGKGTSFGKQSSNPYKGRLKQKRTH